MVDEFQFCIVAQRVCAILTLGTSTLGTPILQDHETQPRTQSIPVSKMAGLGVEAQVSKLSKTVTFII